MNLGHKALLFIAAACVLGGIPTAGQRRESAVAAVTNVSEEDLLARIIRAKVVIQAFDEYNRAHRTPP